MDPRHICAVIDAQGFYLDNRFYPREFSFLCDDVLVNYEVISNMDIDTKINNFGVLANQKRRLHGLSIEPKLADKTHRVILEADIRKLLCELYREVMKDDKSSIAIKNKQLLSYLSDVSIPFYDLEQLEVGNEKCPTLAAFDRFPWVTFVLCIKKFFSH